MANALELHRQLKENSKKNTVIDMADIQNITSRIRGEQNFAPLRNSTQNVPQNFNSNVSSNVIPKSFYNLGNRNTERNLLNNSIDTADGAAFPMSLHKSEEIKLPSLPSLGDARASAVATQDTTDNLVNSAVDNKKAELLANVAKFGALANTAFLPYQAGKEKRDSINNLYDTMMNNTQDKKYSGYSNEELADAYKNIPNYNIVERMFDPKKSAAYGVKQDLSQYAMADAYNKIISQGGKFGEYNALPSRNYEDNYIPALQSNDTSYLKPYADKYGVDVDVLNMLVNAKASGDLEKSYKEFANEHPVASSAASVPANVLGAIPATLYGLKNAATGEVIDTNSPLYGGRKFASDVREEVSSGIDNNLGKFAYNTGMSMGDSLASMALGSAVGSAAGAAGVGASTASAIGSNAGTAIMGMGAYSDTLKEGIERGLTPSQAQLTALGAGLAEYGFEKISWDRLGDIAYGKVDASFLKKVASQMLTEGGEEVGTDLTNTFIDNLVNGGASELMQQRRALVAQGYDEKTAEALVVRNYAKQLGMSFAGGAVSGGVMGAGASVINTGRNIRANLAAAQNVDTQADTNTNIAPEMDMLNPASIFNGNNTKTTTESNQNTEFNPLDPATIFNNQAEAVQTNGNVVGSTENTSNQTGNTAVENANVGTGNVEQRTFQGSKKVNSMPEMSKELSRFVNMFGSDTAQQLYTEFNDKVNTALENGDAEAFNEALNLMDAIETDLTERGHNYTTKGSKNGKKPGRTYSYEADSFSDTFGAYMDEMNNKYIEARERSSSRTIPAEMDNGTVSISEAVDMSQFDNNQSAQQEAGNQTANGQTTTQNATASEQYTGRTITNTIMNSEMVKRAQENLDAFKDEIDNGGFKVDKVSEKASIEKAANNLSADYDGTVKRLNEATQFSSGVEVDESMMVLDDMLKQAEQSRDYKDVMKWTRMLVDKAHNAGQALQALAKYTRTPAGTVAKGQEIMRKQTEDFMNEHPNVDKAVDESIDTLWAELEAAQNNADALTIGDEKGAVSREQVEKIVRDAANKNKNSGLDKMSQSDIDHLVNEIQSGVDHTLIAEEVQNYAATGLFGLTDEDIANIMDYLGEAEKMPDSKERYELEDKAFQIIADKVVTKNFMDKLDSWRYLAMLSNPKTTLRNYLGNQVNRVTTGVSNSIAGLIESKLSQKYNIKRTKEVLTKADSELVQKATADAEQNAYSLLRDGGDKYRNAQSRIEQSKSAFSTKAMQKVEDLTSRMLDDLPAMRKKYGTSLAGYMKANDMDMSYFNVADDLKAAKAELASLNTETDGARIKELTGQISTLEAKQNKMDTARAYAVTKAKEATFHEYSAFASWISKVSNNWKDGNMLQKFGHLVIEGILPFKKTPANIMKQGAKLATGPVQTGIGLYQLYNALSSGRNGGKYDATAAIERISTGLTGSGILALGALLSNLGLIVSVPDDDKDNNFNKLTGGQNYALKLGDNYYTIDWLSPVSIPLFAGVNAEMMFADKTDKSVLDVLGDLSAPLVEMSMLQGLSETLETATQSDDANNAIVRMGTSAATNYASQYVPTMLGQVARTVDNTRRNNVGNDKGVVGDLQYAANKVENKIPFLSMTNEPYVDAWGNQQKDENNILFRGLYNAFSPGYYSKQDKDAVEKELDVVRTSTDDSSVYPSNAPRQINTANGSVRLTEKEYTKYATAKGQMQYKAVNNLIKSEMYDNLTDAQKVDVIKDIYKYSGLVAQNDIGKPAKSTEAVDAYKNDGIKGIVNLAISKNVGGDKAFQVLQDLGEEGYNQYWQIKSEADADGNNSLKQAEVKEYLDKQVMLNERKAYWFDIYCPKAKTNPYRTGTSSESTSSSTSSKTDDAYLRYVRSILGN